MVGGGLYPADRPCNGRRCQAELGVLGAALYPTIRVPNAGSAGISPDSRGRRSPGGCEA
jgi:hypothetical protein